MHALHAADVITSTRLPLRSVHTELAFAPADVEEEAAVRAAAAAAVGRLPMTGRRAHCGGHLLLLLLVGRHGRGTPRKGFHDGAPVRHAASAAEAATVLPAPPVLAAQHDHQKEMHSAALEVRARTDEAVTDGMRAAEGAYAVAPQPGQEVGALRRDGMDDEELRVLQCLRN